MSAMNDNFPNPRAVIGDNKAPEPVSETAEKSPLDRARERMDLEVASANEWSAQYQEIEDAALANEANQKLDQLDAVWNEIEAIRKAEYKVHDDRAKAVQRNFKPLLDGIAACRLVIHRLHQGWLAFDQRRIDAERVEKERIAAEERRRADQLAEQAKAIGPNAATRIIQAKEAEAEAERARQAAAAAPKRAQTHGTLGGRTRSLRTVWAASIVEQDLVYRHFRNRAEVKDLLQSLANAAARGGIRNPNLPGCWVFSEEQ